MSLLLPAVVEAQTQTLPSASDKGKPLTGLPLTSGAQVSVHCVVLMGQLCTSPERSRLDLLPASIQSEQLLMEPCGRKWLSSLLQGATSHTPSTFPAGQSRRQNCHRDLHTEAMEMWSLEYCGQINAGRETEAQSCFNKIVTTSDQICHV